jgi:hypothetical protein
MDIREPVLSRAALALGTFSLGLILVAGVAPGCKKDQAPRAAGIAPAAPGSAPASAAAPAAPPPAPGAAAAPAAGGGGGKTISGKIVLADARKATVTPNHIVYLTARRPPDTPGQRGSLVAVKRYSASSFPIDFELGSADMMFGNGVFEGDLELTVRVDRDGDPLTRQKGDVFGVADRVKVGASRVEIKLDGVLEKDESLMGSGPPPPGGPAKHP